MNKIPSQTESERRCRPSFPGHFLPLAIKALFLLLLISVALGGEVKPTEQDAPAITTKKYIAFSADTEAYFTPRDFEHFQGEYTRQIMEACQESGIPFTWLIIMDDRGAEITPFSKTIYPLRRNVDEFSLHVHFKWFIMDSDDDFKSFKIVDRRMKWLKDAKASIEQNNLPMPSSFRYGGGDSQDKYYCIEDLVYLHDEMGIRNYLFNPDRLPGVIGISHYEQKGNGVWIIDGGREITLLSTCVYLDERIDSIKAALKQRLGSADYAIIGSHDYRKTVPGNLRKTIKHLNDNYDVEYVTIDRIGEMVRKGELGNHSWAESAAP